MQQLPTHMSENKSMATPSGGPATMSWFRAPPKVYFGYASTLDALRDLEELKLRKALVLSDRAIHNLGYTRYVQHCLSEHGVESELYVDITEPSAQQVKAIQRVMRIYMPEILVAVGGGSVMDMGKIARFIYDPSKPVAPLDQLLAYDYKQLLVSNPEPLNKYIKQLICIPTTSGTGSEMTPIAWVIEEGQKCSNELPLRRPIVSFAMTPDIAINDAYYVQQLPKDVVISGGLLTLLFAVESLVSRLASDYTRGFSSKAAKLVFQHLPQSVMGQQVAREACHRAASVAGLAMANSFAGIAYAIGFVLSNYVEAKRGKRISQGVAASLVLPQVIRFNANKSAEVANLYAGLANDVWGHQSESNSAPSTAGAERLAEGITKLCMEIGQPMRLSDYISKDELHSSAKPIAEDSLKVVGCAECNPTDVTVDHIRAILVESS